VLISDYFDAPTESKNDHTNEGMDDFLAQKAWELNL